MKKLLRRTALIACGMLALPCAAQAAVTQSKVTSFGATPFPLYDGDALDPAANTVALTGTTDGTPGDTVDLVCGPFGSTVATDLPVGAGGSVSATVSLGPVESRHCRLRLVPDPAPADLAPFEPLDVYTGFRGSERNVSGEVTDYLITQPQPLGYADYRSLGGGGLWDMSHRSDGTESQYLFYGNGYLEAEHLLDGVWTPSVEIDDRPAYAPDTLARFNSTASGIPALTYAHTVDPATGDVTITESDPLSTCEWAPEFEEDCTAYRGSGVTIERTIHQDHGGRMVRIVDLLRSTDGAAHTYGIDFDQWLYGSQVGYRFPGESAYSTRVTGDTVAGPAAPISTTYFRHDNEAPADPIDNPYGTQTVSPAPERALFLAEDGFVQRFTGTIPAGGSRRITQVFTMGGSEAEVAALAAEAEDRVDAPVVAITGPAPIVGTPAVTVTGTASDNKGVTSLTLNGRTVAVGADGTWSAPATLVAGANQLTAVARDAAGNESTATRTVSYVRTAEPPKDPAGLGTLERSGRAKLRKRGKRLAVATGATLACAAGGPACRASVVLTVRGRKGKRRRLGRAGVTAAPGTKATFVVKLSRKGARMLKPGRRTKVLATYTLRAADGSTRLQTTPLSLKAPKRGRR